MSIRTPGSARSLGSVRAVIAIFIVFAGFLAVHAQTQVATSVANPFALMQTSNRVPLKRLMVDAPSLIVACGLAMRRFDPV